MNQTLVKRSLIGAAVGAAVGATYAITVNVVVPLVRSYNDWWDSTHPAPVDPTQVLSGILLVPDNFDAILGHTDRVDRDTLTEIYIDMFDSLPEKHGIFVVSLPNEDGELTDAWGCLPVSTFNDYYLVRNIDHFRIGREFVEIHPIPQDAPL